MNKQQTVRIIYVKSPDYRVFAVNGAWGSVTANGTIQADLYVEQVPPPQEVIHPIEGDRLGPPEYVPPADDRRIERHIQFGLLLSPDSARVIGQWLLEKAEEYDRLFGPPQEPDGDPTEEEDVLAG